MNAITAIYLVSVLDNIRSAIQNCALLALLLGCGAIFFYCYFIIENRKGFPVLKKTGVFFLAMLPALALLYVASPSRPFIAAMAAVYVGQEIAGTETATRLGAKGVDVLEKFMDDYLNEEKPQPKNNGGRDV